MDENTEHDDLIEDSEPIDETPAPLPVEALAPSARQKDVELYNQWAKTRSKDDMSALIKHLTPLIYTEVHRASGTLPKSALAGEATLWTIKAVKSYDPSKGFALSTHVMNYLPKVRRKNYTYQNSARLPENQQRQFAPYNKALTNLTEELNREPNDEEMAQRLGWSKPYVVKYKKRLIADDIESAAKYDTEVSQYSDEALLLKEIKSRLTPDEVKIWDSKIAKVPAPQIAQSLGVDINRLNYMQRKLTKKVADMKMEFGL